MSSTATAIFLPRTPSSEPPAGAVVMLEGPTGTAYQRLFSTDRWHSVTQGTAVSFSWAELLRRTERPGALPPLLVFDPTTARVAVEGTKGASTSEQLPTLAQLDEIETLADRIEREVTMPASRAEAASVLITLRARVKELQADGTIQ